MKSIKEQRESESIPAEKWIANVTEGKIQADIVTFLSVAWVIVKKMENYYPTDTQLVAVLVLAGSSNRKTSSRGRQLYTFCEKPGKKKG